MCNDLYLPCVSGPTVPNSRAAPATTGGVRIRRKTDTQPYVHYMSDIWKDPMVREALKDGRPPSDIAILPCPTCGEWGYYNEGTWFSCRFCHKSWRVNDHLSDEIISLADIVTVTTNGYDNANLN